MTALAELYTRRLLLLPIASADAGRVAEIGAQADVAGMTISVPQPMTTTVAGDWISQQRCAIEAGTAATYTARLRRDHPALGVIALHHIDRAHGCAELSFWFCAESRGNGFASEAARALARYGFDQFGLHRIEAYHMTRNAASERVLERIGFQFEGVLRDRVVKASVRRDVKLWAMLRTDWWGDAARQPSAREAHD